jgi:hypothetical protein
MAALADVFQLDIRNVDNNRLKIITWSLGAARWSRSEQPCMSLVGRSDGQV